MAKPIPKRDGIYSSHAVAIGQFLRSDAGIALMAELRRTSPARQIGLALDMSAPSTDVSQHFLGRAVQFEQNMSLLESLQQSTYIPTD